MIEPALFDDSSKLSATLRGRRVCITGGRGALGSRLTHMLLSCGVDSVTTVGQHAPRTDVSPRQVRHFIGSVMDTTALDIAFTGCSVVFHLAGLTPSQCAGDRIGLAYDVNTRGSIQVLEACYRAGVSRLVFVSTAHVYGRPVTQPVREDHPTAPMSVYAASKLAAEVALQGASHRGGIVCDIARLSNVFGASFDEGTVIGRAVSHAAARQAITLDDLRPVRDFLHEDDAVAALVALACCDADGADSRIVNVSSGRGVAIDDIARTVVRVASETGLGTLSVREPLVKGPLEVPTLVLDNTRLKRLTGWQPRVSLEEGLRRALAERLRHSERVSL